MIVLATSLFYLAEQCYDKILVNYLDTAMFVDPITRPTFGYANQIPCESSLQNVIALDPDIDQYYVLTPQPFKKTLLYPLNPLKFKPILAPTPLLLKMRVFILKKNLKHFWNRILFTESSDNT